ncbi:MAG: cob(I)yrinic acid a,c-diamide adenosyltransferase [Selenomonadaceae bacterium]
MGVYTKTGDEGKTSLYTGERVEKVSLRVEAYGTIDELNAALAMARAFCKKAVVKEKIMEVQKLNSMLMADLASLSQPERIKEENVAMLEKIMDEIEGKLPPLASFIVPGDTIGGAALDLARTITRRAERRVLELAKTELVNKNDRLFLNRLSDFCFMLMRFEEATAVEPK